MYAIFDPRKNHYLLFEPTEERNSDGKWGMWTLLQSSGDKPDELDKVSTCEWVVPDEFFQFTSYEAGMAYLNKRKGG